MRVIIGMDTENNLQNNKISNSEIMDAQNPIKQLHYVDGKYFIVLDNSIIESLKLLDENIYFSQEVTTDGRIILRLVRCGG
jgi:hypothetical protein